MQAFFYFTYSGIYEAHGINVVTASHTSRTQYSAIVLLLFRIITHRQFAVRGYKCCSMYQICNHLDLSGKYVISLFFHLKKIIKNMKELLISPEVAANQPKSIKFLMLFNLI